MEQYVITIGREYGSRGREIGEKLAKELKIGFYDKELLEIAAQRLETDVKSIQNEDENITNKVNAFLKTHKLVEHNNSKQDKLFMETKEVLLDKVKRESFVVIGRCADYILKNAVNCLNVYIFAPKSNRIYRIKNEYGLTEESATDIVDRVDKDRHSYYKHYTKCNRGERSNKQILIDSSLLGVDGTVEILKEIVVKKFKLNQ